MTAQRNFVWATARELVTPRHRATSAPEYPNSRTAIQDTIPLASIISRLRLPEHSSPRLIPCFLQTLPANVTISTCRPESRRFFLTRSSRSDVTSRTNSLSPSIRVSDACFSPRLLSAKTDDQPPKLLIKPPPTNSGLRPCGIPFSTYLR